MRKPETKAAKAARWALNKDRINAARRAARANGGHALPDGQRLKGVSTLSDAAGNLSSEWVKTERESDDPPKHEPIPAGHHVTSTATLLDGQGEVRAQWIRSQQDKAAQEAAFFEAMRSHAAEYRGLVKRTAAPRVSNASLLSVYPIGDAHVGLLAWAPETGDSHDLAIGIRDLTTAFQLLTDAAPPSETAMLINVGDFFHAQNDSQTTPGHGHKLDVDGRWPKVIRAGLDFLRNTITLLLAKHRRVIVINVPGNHDPDLARMVVIWLQMAYENEPRVEIRPNHNPYDAIEFGLNMIATAHGDGCARKELPDLFAADFAEIWGRTKFRHCYSGHIHHETVTEGRGMTIETLRTLVGKDGYHTQRAYRAGRSIDVVTHHRRFGPSQRTRIDISRVRAAQ